MSRSAAHDDYTRKILSAIDEGRSISQRALARDLGVALGMCNLLLRRLVTKGYVKVAGLRPNRVRYLLTPAGVAEKMRISREYFANTVHLYTETRDRIRTSFERLSTEWPAVEDTKRIVFYGAGEVAEIGYVSLQGTDLRLVAVVDDHVRRSFFGHTVVGPDVLRPDASGPGEGARVIVMSFRKAEVIQERLRHLGVPSDRVFTL